MAVHIIHIRKTGGTAIKTALRLASKAAGGPLHTPHGDIVRHPHAFRLADVPAEDHAIFSVRDPASRFVSGFYSRLRKGAPRYYREWSRAEQKAFGWFPTPQELAVALTRTGRERRRAEFAMGAIRHVRTPMVWWTGSADDFRRQLPQVLYIARQETLDDDFERLKRMLELPSDLQMSTDPVKTHRFTGDDDRSLTPEMVAALREWFAADYELLEVCDEARGGMIAPATNSPPHTLAR